MDAVLLLIIAVAVVALGLVATVAGLLVTRRRKPEPLPNTHTGVIVRPPEEVEAGAAPVEVSAPPATIEPEAPAAPTLEKPEGTASRLVRLRQRLAGSQGGLGRGLLALLSRDRLDEDTWESIEDTRAHRRRRRRPDPRSSSSGVRTRLRVEGAARRRPRGAP